MTGPAVGTGRVRPGTVTQARLRVGPARARSTTAPPPGWLAVVDVRDATPAELAAVGELRVGAYQAQDLLAGAPGYAGTLRALGPGPGAEVLVAVEGGRLLGTVLLQAFGAASQVARSPDEAELRALAVAPAAQGRGVGRALLGAALDRARARGARHLVLCTDPAMLAAQRLYRAAGFVRLADRDWSPLPGVGLLAFRLDLEAGEATGDDAASARR